MINAMFPEPDIQTGGQPSDEDLRQFKAQGYKTIINLRPPTEHPDFDEASLVESLGMTYINIPTTSALDRDLVDRFHRALEDHDGPVVVHCASGNRVGALFALRANWILEKDPEAAFEYGVKSGLTAMAPLVRSLL